MAIIKGIVERTPLAAMYRTIRDEWRQSRKKFSRTPRGYDFAGRPDMQTCSFEQAELSLLEQYLLMADVFVDVGANVGYYSCLSRSKGKHTVAIEPLAENFRDLVENLHRNGWSDGVEVYQLALSDRPGLALLYGGSTGASLLSGWAGSSPRHCRIVSLSTLDILLGSRFAGRQMLVKMDIEGAEYAALTGATNVMQRQPRPIWLVEITLSDHRCNPNPHFVNTFDLFFGSGYSASPAAFPDRMVSRTELEEYARGGARPQWHTGNYLFR